MGITDEKLCINCKHHLQEDSRINQECWYHHFCKKVERIAKEFVYGKSHTEYAHCREINPEGKCEMFEDE